MKRFKIEIKWAVIFSIVAILWMWIEKLAGLHDKYIDYHQYLTNLFFFPAVAMMILALREKKQKFYKGNITYWQGMKSGLVLSAFIAILSPVNQWITTYVITPEYFPNVIKRSVELGYFATIEEAQNHFNFENYVVMSFIFSFVMGIITTSIVMIFLKRKNNKPDNVES